MSPRRMPWLAALLLGTMVTAQATETVVYYHTDALHSTTVVTNAQGQVIERTHYAPYGAVLNRALRDGPGYAGHEEDAATGLVYMQQRYYDPESGTFLSTDPVQADPNGASFNRYWYANDNPYRYTDPDGRCPWCVGAVIGAVVDIAAQKIVNPHGSINWKSVAVSAAVGAATGGVASIARAAAIRGTISVSQAIVRTGAASAAIGAAGSAADSAVNGQTPSASKMAVAAAANGIVSMAAGASEASGTLAAKMTAAKPDSPAGIGGHIMNTTNAAAGSIRTGAEQGAASAAGRVANIAREGASATGQQMMQKQNQQPKCTKQSGGC